MENDIYFDCITDYRCGINHLRIMYYAMKNETFTAQDVIKIFKYTQPYCSKILNQLVNFEYLELIGRELDTGKKVYKVKGR